jgi:hypothetical protein
MGIVGSNTLKNFSSPFGARFPRTLHLSDSFCLDLQAIPVELSDCDALCYESVHAELGDHGVRAVTVTRFAANPSNSGFRV